MTSIERWKVPRAFFKLKGIRTEQYMMGRECRRISFSLFNLYLPVANVGVQGW